MRAIVSARRSASKGQRPSSCCDEAALATGAKRRPLRYGTEQRRHLRQCAPPQAVQQCRSSSGLPVSVREVGNNTNESLTRRACASLYMAVCRDLRSYWSDCVTRGQRDVWIAGCAVGCMVWESLPHRMLSGSFGVCCCKPVLAPSTKHLCPLAARSMVCLRQQLTPQHQLQLSTPPRGACTALAALRWRGH